MLELEWKTLSSFGLIWEVGDGRGAGRVIRTLELTRQHL
jgi:hypothetical protein